MLLYRVAKRVQAETAFRGSRRRGRWHKLGTPMVYAADSPATAILETLVHIDRTALLVMPFVAFEVKLNPARHLLRLTHEELPDDWQAWPWPAATQEIGTFWFESRASVVLEVPSAVVPLQKNYLINIEHPSFEELEITGPVDFPIAPRLAGGSTKENL